MQTDATTLTVTGTAQREAWQRRVLPPVEVIAPGVHSVPVVFPENPMRYTLSYVLLDGDECVVVDPGFDSDAGHGQLLAALARLDVGPREITGIVATHFHTDHLGMAARLARGSGAGLPWGETSAGTSPRSRTRTRSRPGTALACGRGASLRTGWQRRP